MGLSIRQQKRQRFNRAAEVLPGMTWEIFQQLEAERGVYDEDKWLNRAKRPRRIQLSRKKGWRMPLNALKVDRSTKYGNPFILASQVKSPGKKVSQVLPVGIASTREESVDLFRQYATHKAKIEPGWLSPLRGKNLACWCKPGAKCHADVLLELANR